MITPRLISGPILEPVSLFDAKDHLRVDIDNEDALIEMYIAAAREYIQGRTGRSIGLQTWEILFNRFPIRNRVLYLPRATPLVSVDSVTYTDTDGVETVWPSDQYEMDTHSMPGGIYPATGVDYPSFDPHPAKGLRIRYSAGDVPVGSPPTSYSVPRSLQAAILLMTGALYQNREAVSISSMVFRDLETKYGIDALIEPNIVEYAF